ncbi:MAG TPA: GlmL-related ornithine degradation protein [Clostridia bacterium]|nr:GlmL-related ornithine degradation protein [Clostridia bacterium]HPQ46403.1 GlmL-related ornithine degradation protein [Clostridia bacterium]HRX41338.1 GlmL-related ornithine degradation protein [Clostridia bacterium]
MKLDILVAEIGSTTTVVNGFWLGKDACYAGSGQAPTTVLDGDVNIGLSNAIDDFKKNMGTDDLLYDEMMATSSAAGGLRMTVHGLVYDMTVKAAREAALGAGANIHMVTAGKLRKTDLEKIIGIRPNIILIAGGVDYGECETALYNAREIAGLNLDVPVIYAGNIQNRDEMKQIFDEAGMKVYIVDNVYPRIDQLNVEPTRKVIQEVFEEHITNAPGMSKVREMVSGNIIPTPAGVMEATKLLSNLLGDVVTIDIGGATTDIHSVTEGSEEISRILISPEPAAKRTVEGDLGVYINIRNIIDLATKEWLLKELGLNASELEELIDDHKPIPKTSIEKIFVEKLAYVACKTAIARHAGDMIDVYSTSGRKKAAMGKDLTAVKYIIGTGGVLTRLPGRTDILKNIINEPDSTKLLPNRDATVLIDNHYIMASVGVMSKTHPTDSLEFLRQSLRL